MAEKVKDRAAGLFSGLKPGSLRGAARVGNPVRRAAALVRGWGEKFPLPRGIREKLPWLEGKRVFILIGLVFALAVLSAVLAAGLSRRPAAPAPAAGVFQPAPIPPEDLFLPEEPDFLPPVILERERREVWTGEDAKPFWYRPLEDGEDIWREQMEKAIDDLLERVP
jgi:hypothetical protein